MRHETEVRRRIRVAESCDCRSQLHHTGDGLASRLGEFAVGEHLVLAVLGEAHVYVETRSSLASSDLRCEGHVVAILVAEVADHPLSDHQLIGSLFGINGEELDLVLLVDIAVEREVTHLRVAVFDLSAGLCDVRHALGAEVVELGVGARLVVALLIRSLEVLIVFLGNDNVVFQLAHGLELHARDVRESLASLVECILGCALERLSVLIEVRAEHGEGRDFSEWVDEGGTETRNSVEVATAGTDKGEETRTVDALAAGQDRIQILLVRNDEIECFQSTISRRIHEVDHLDIVLTDERDDVGLGKFRSRLLRKRNQAVGVH